MIYDGLCAFAHIEKVETPTVLLYLSLSRAQSLFGRFSADFPEEKSKQSQSSAGGTGMSGHTTSQQDTGGDESASSH